MSVRIQCVRGTGLSSAAIAWFGGIDQFSHIDSVLPDGTLIGARSDVITLTDGTQIPPGVRIRPPNYEKWQRRVVFEVPATPIQARDWEKFLRQQETKPYDTSLILGFALGTMWGAPRDWREVDSWICSELAIRALEVSRIIHEVFVPASKISPNDGALIVSSKAKIVESEHYFGNA